MTDILRGLFNGDIIPWERRDPHSKQHLVRVRRREEEEQYFMSKMWLDNCQRFQALPHLHSELITLEEENILSYGFTLGCC